MTVKVHTAPPGNERENQTQIGQEGECSLSMCQVHVWEVYIQFSKQRQSKMQDLDPSAHILYDKN